MWPNVSMELAGVALGGWYWVARSQVGGSSGHCTIEGGGAHCPVEGAEGQCLVTGARSRCTLESAGAWCPLVQGSRSKVGKSKVKESMKNQVSVTFLVIVPVVLLAEDKFCRGLGIYSRSLTLLKAAVYL